MFEKYSNIFLYSFKSLFWIHNSNHEDNLKYFLQENLVETRRWTKTKIQ